MDGDPRPLIVGLGNEDRGDDGCGRVAARRLRGRLGSRALVEDGASEGTRLLDLWQERPTVYVVDATSSGSPPGTIHRFDVSGATRLPRRPLTSSHGLSLAEAIELGRALDQLPGRLTVFGIEVGSMGLGHSLSDPVLRAVDEVVERIAQEIEPSPTPEPPRPEEPNHT